MFIPGLLSGALINLTAEDMQVLDNNIRDHRMIMVLDKLRKVSGNGKGGPVTMQELQQANTSREYDSMERIQADKIDNLMNNKNNPSKFQDIEKQLHDRIKRLVKS